MRQLFHELPLKKAAGADGIMAEHLCFADHSIFHCLAIILNLCLCHGMLLDKYVETITIPAIKVQTV